MKTIKNFDKFLNESINDKLDISDVLYKLKHGDILKSKSISDTGIAHQFKLKDDENIYKIYFIYKIEYLIKIKKKQNQN